MPVISARLSRLAIWVQYISGSNEPPLSTFKPPARLWPVQDSQKPYRRGQELTQTLPVLMELRAQGLVKAIGAGMNQWEMELRFAKEGDFDGFPLAGRYTLLEQTALHEFLPYCVEKKISVIAGGPYNSGILAANHLTSAATYNYRESPPAIIEKAQKIKAVCDRYHVPMRAAALQFILAHPAIVSVIPGARSVNELEENFELVTHPIPAAFWAELKAEKLIVAHAPTPSES
jgi:D-threo-aldose 1-dehydrogenase